MSVVCKFFFLWQGGRKVKSVFSSRDNLSVGHMEEQNSFTTRFKIFSNKKCRQLVYFIEKNKNLNSSPNKTFFVGKNILSQLKHKFKSIES